MKYIILIMFLLIVLKLKKIFNMLHSIMYDIIKIKENKFLKMLNDENYFEIVINFENVDEKYKNYLKMIKYKLFICFFTLKEIIYFSF